MQAPSYGPYIDREMIEALDRAIEHSTFLAAPIHRFERGQLLSRRKTPEIVKRLYLAWAAVLIGLAEPFARIACWLLDSSEAPLGWCWWDEATPLGQRRRGLLNREWRLRGVR